MAWNFVDNWQVAYNYQTTDGRVAAVRRNGTGTDYWDTAAFDYFTDTAVANDWLEFSYGTRYWGVRVNVATAFAASSVTFVWEYYTTSNTWVTLNVTNNNAFLSTGIQDITFTPPPNWGVYVNADNGWTIRCRISAVSDITEGGANGTDKVKWNFKCLQVTGTVSGMSAALTGDLAGTYTILPATTSAVAIPTLEMPTSEIGEVSFVDVILSGTTAGAGDTVDINGTDQEETALTETIDVSAGDGTYTSTKQYRNITSVDCNGFSDGTIQVDQKRWGIISKYIDNSYLLKTHLCVGDGSTATTFTLNRHTLTFCFGAFWYVNQATFNCGTSVGSGLYEGSYNGTTFNELQNDYVGYGSHWKRNFGTVVINHKGCNYNFGTFYYTYIWYFTGGTLTFTDCNWNGLDESVYFKCYGVGPTLTRCNMNGMSFSVGYATATFTKVKMTSVAYAEETSNILTLDTCYLPTLQTWCHSDNARFDFIDMAISTSSILHPYGLNPTSTDSVRIEYRFDLKVVDASGTGISGATVTIVDLLGATVATLTTDVSGDITQQILKYKVGDHIYPNAYYTWNTHSPHTVTISKTGYATKTVIYTMDRKREEIEVLEQVKDYNFSKRGRLITQ